MRQVGSGTTTCQTSQIIPDSGSNICFVDITLLNNVNRTGITSITLIFNMPFSWKWAKEPRIIKCTTFTYDTKRDRDGSPGEFTLNSTQKSLYTGIISYRILIRSRLLFSCLSENQILRVDWQSNVANICCLYFGVHIYKLVLVNCFKH